ncbi:MAG: formyl transferase [Burkholderiales bacterium]|nr:formyl transferase [Burkholderiales bacterium]
MRIVLLAVDDEFAGRMQRHVYEQRPGAVVGSVISTCAIYKKSPLQATFFVLRRSGLRYGFEMFRMKVIRKFTDRTVQPRPSELARKHNVEVFYSRNINDHASLAKLAKWSPDLVISTNFSHYIGRHARAIAKIATLNLHKSLLPCYRGMAPSFYALLEGAQEVGATLHVVADGFDTGDIVCQTRVPVVSGDTVLSLNRKTSDAGGRMLAALLCNGDVQRLPSNPQPPGNWPSYSFPAAADVHAFLGKGLRF